MNMVMKAEVCTNRGWTRSGRDFKSSFYDYLSTDRVCDERNPILYKVFGGKPECVFRHTEIGAMPHHTEYEIGVGDVSASTLEDIVKYNWNTIVSQVALISEWQYRRMKEKGIKPVIKNMRHYSKSAKIITQLEMDMILKNKNLKQAGAKYYVEYEYDAKPLREWCKFFYEESIPALMKLIPEGGTSKDVRVVYWFV